MNRIEKAVKTEVLPLELGKLGRDYTEPSRAGKVKARKAKPSRKSESNSKKPGRKPTNGGHQKVLKKPSAANAKPGSKK